MKTILVPIDFSDVTNAVLDHAILLAQKFASRIDVVHVAAPEPTFVGYEPGPQVVRYQVATELREEHRLVQNLAQKLRDQGLDAHGLMLQGSTVECIVERAKKIAADLIILGSHGHGAIHRVLLGSVSEGVVRHATCPVLIVPARLAHSANPQES
ncbi:MAG TPA: universal stress protein [Terriglobales bacterium]|nr:universal stress protein [Terriglobales bacterium]